jgi:hypothetical protein
MGSPPQSDWYEVVEGGDDLLQADLIAKCPVVQVDPASMLSVVRGESDALDARVDTISACVLTQSCDLENERVTEILVAAVLPWEMVVEYELERGNARAASSGHRTALQRGNLPGLCLLNEHTEAPTLPWSVVDFHQLAIVDREILRWTAGEGGPRLRLMSPYREHVGQEFARYVMRVGLPVSAEGFVAAFSKKK